MNERKRGGDRGGDVVEMGEDGAQAQSANPPASGRPTEIR